MAKKKIKRVDFLRLPEEERAKALLEMEIIEETVQSRIEDYNKQNMDKINAEKIDASRGKILFIRGLLKQNAPIIYNIFANRKLGKNGGAETHQDVSPTAIQHATD